MPERKASRTVEPQQGTVHVALLRGINLGGKNRLPMSFLRALFQAAGCESVKTYIQSGNVIFRTTDEVAERMSDLVTRKISQEFGFSVPVVIRTARELESVVADNPFLKADRDTKTLHVMFLADEPDPRDVAALDLSFALPDTFVVRGREIFLCCPNGLARTRLTNAYFDRKLGSKSTCRNWQTVVKLRELARH